MEATSNTARTGFARALEATGILDRITVEDVVRERERLIRVGDMKEIETPFGTLSIMTYPLLRGTSNV